MAVVYLLVKKYPIACICFFNVMRKLGGVYEKGLNVFINPIGCPIVRGL